MQGPPTDIHERWFVITWLLLSAWLVACALLIGGEFGDGYQTIANARYFFGESRDYFVQRGPLAALVLWPIEYAVHALHLHPLDVRPYHLYSAGIHSAYLIGCWLLLKRSGSFCTARLIAFAAAILTVVFFANAPYLSHDLVPGLLFLLMIFLGDKWIREPNGQLAAGLVLIGTAVTLIKQTYAIFWIAICLYATLAFLLKLDHGRVSLKKLVAVFGLAGVSGALSWIGYGWFIGGQLPDVALIERPLRLIQSVTAQYQQDGDVTEIFPWSLYLQNAHNYGIVMCLLVIPGVALAFRANDARAKMIAICWLIGLVAIQSVGFREVRYLAFLAPLSAYLLVPVVARVLQLGGAAVILLGAILGMDQYRALSMAAAQLTTTPVMNVTRFIGDTTNHQRFISSGVLSFAYMPGSPMRHDRYHGIYHLTAELLFRLHEGRIAVRKMPDPRDLGTIGLLPGDYVYFSNLTLARRPPWQPGNVPLGLGDLVTIAGVTVRADLLNDGKVFRVTGAGDRQLLLVPRPDAGRQMPMITTGELSAEQARYFFGDTAGEDSGVLVVVIDAICRADSCTYFLPDD